MTETICDFKSGSSSHQQPPVLPVLLHHQLHVVHQAGLTQPADGEQLLDVDGLQPQVHPQEIDFHRLSGRDSGEVFIATLIKGE